MRERKGKSRAEKLSPPPLHRFAEQIETRERGNGAQLNSTQLPKLDRREHPRSDLERVLGDVR